jgi:hypothetical protein
MGNQVLSLSRKGYLTDMGEKADRIFAYYLTNDYSQSFLYKGNVTSLQSTIQQVGSADALTLQSQVRSDLQSLFNAYFDLAVVTVTVTTPAWDGSNRYNIAIGITVTDNGVTQSLGTLLLQAQDGIVQTLTNANNG